VHPTPTDRILNKERCRLLQGPALVSRLSECIAFELRDHARSLGGLRLSEACLTEDGRAGQPHPNATIKPYGRISVSECPIPSSRDHSLEIEPHGS